MTAITDRVDEAALARVLADAGLPEDLRWRVTVSARRRTVGLSAEPGGSLMIRVPVDSQPSDVGRAIRKRMRLDRPDHRAPSQYRRRSSRQGFRGWGELCLPRAQPAAPSRYTYATGCNC